MIVERAEIVAVLRDAAELIGERGWVQNRFVDQDSGALCIDGALMLSRGCNPYKTYPAPAAVNAARRTLVRHIDQDLCHWNDEPGRSEIEVLNALEKAAKLAEAT